MVYLTDEHRSLLNRPGPRQTASQPVSADALRRFVQGVMEPDPVHWDEDVARRSRYGEIVAPPLYPLHAFRLPAGSPDPLDRLADNPDWDGAGGGGGFGGLPPIDLPLDRILNGGTEAEFFQRARIGDVISTQSRYVAMDEREGKSGPMVIVTVETEYRNQDDELLMRVRTTMIRR